MVPAPALRPAPAPNLMRDLPPDAGYRPGRYAAVDVGTNSVLVLVADVDADRLREESKDVIRIPTRAHEHGEVPCCLRCRARKAGWLRKDGSSSCCFASRGGCCCAWK